MPVRLNLLSLPIVLVGLLLLGTLPATAHDIENTHVLIVFTPDGWYQIEILNDPDWTWLSLTGNRDELPGFDERDEQLARLTEKFLESVTVTFDGEPASAGDIAYLPPVVNGASAPIGWAEPGIMRLTGQAPAGARTFQFAYGLVDHPYPLTISPPNAEPVTRWLLTSELSEAFPIADLQPMTRLQVSRQYLGLGFTHILPKGLDHILFVIGLFLLSAKLKPLLWQITAFTVAHTLTLGLTIYGVFSLAPSIVEPLIALSIAYVAVENLVTSELKPWRVGLVFAFGLLHGMGFAGVLADLGLPRTEFLTALLTFNVGVELGQLTVIGMAFVGVVGVLERHWYRQRIVVPLSLGIATVGLYWTVERLAAG